MSITAERSSKEEKEKEKVANHLSPPQLDNVWKAKQIKLGRLLSKTFNRREKIVGNEVYTREALEVMKLLNIQEPIPRNGIMLPDLQKTLKALAAL